MDPAASPDPEPSPSVAGRLHELRDKYEQLVVLRRTVGARAMGRRDAMRAVAARFPGALREWDTLPMEELLRRLAVVTRAMSQVEQGEAPAALSATSEPWLRYALDLHPHLRALLTLRSWRRRDVRPVDATLLAIGQRLYDEAGPAWPERLSTARLSLIAAPPGGRLTEIAYRDVAARHGVTVAAVKQALYSPSEESQDPR